MKSVQSKVAGLIEKWPGSRYGEIYPAVERMLDIMGVNIFMWVWLSFRWG